jgi:hypothetical protein
MMMIIQFLMSWYLGKYLLIHKFYHVIYKDVAGFYSNTLVSYSIVYLILFS